MPRTGSPDAQRVPFQPTTQGEQLAYQIGQGQVLQQDLRRSAGRNLIGAVV